MTHLIFEGAELSGKSFVMSQVYGFLEEKYHQDPNRLDGCYWFNCDVGLFGSKQGKGMVHDYLRMLERLDDENVLLEKFHLSDKVYNKLYRHKHIGYRRTEKRLDKLGYQIIFLTFPEDEALIKNRLADRLNLYPHYQRIAKSPSFYIKQQRLYRQKIKASRLPCLEIEIMDFPDDTVLEAILEFAGEE